jgi:uncharacterized protein
MIGQPAIDGLTKACRSGELETVRTLVGEGIDINATDIAGWTPLKTAANYAQHDIVCMLLTAGADVNQVDLDGETALIRASQYAPTDLLCTLLQWGATVDIKNHIALFSL